MYCAFVNDAFTYFTVAEADAYRLTIRVLSNQSNLYVIHKGLRVLLTADELNSLCILALR
jgi:hypothetical protein